LVRARSLVSVTSGAIISIRARGEERLSGATIGSKAEGVTLAGPCPGSRCRCREDCVPTIDGGN